MKKILILLAAIVIFGSIGYATFNSATSGSKDRKQSSGQIKNQSVKVGVILPLSGQYASLGESDKNAMLLAKQELKAENIELIFEDDKYDAKTAVTAYKKLKNIDNIDAVVVLSAPSIQALKPLTDADAIPLLGLGATNVYVKDTVFQLMPSGNLLFPTLGKIYGEKYKKIAVAHSNATLFDTNTKGFRKGLPANVEAPDYIITSGSDMRTEVQKILSTKPDAVTTFMPKEDAIKFLKALRVLDQKGSVKIVCDFGTEIAIEEYSAAIGKDRLEGCISTNIADTMKEAFKKKYKEIYGADPLITSDYSYDAIQIISELASSKPKNEWVSTINAANYSINGDASGEIKFNEEGTREDMAPSVDMYTDGKFVPVK